MHALPGTGAARAPASTGTGAGAVAGAAPVPTGAGAGAVAGAAPATPASSGAVAGTGAGSDHGADVCTGTLLLGTWTGSDHGQVGQPSVAVLPSPSVSAFPQLLPPGQSSCLLAQSSCLHARTPTR